MFDFTLHENIYDARLVNDQAAAWASRINLFDLEDACGTGRLAQRNDPASRTGPTSDT